mgnify:CR=1 FL=1
MITTAIRVRVKIAIIAIIVVSPPHRSWQHLRQTRQDTLAWPLPYDIAEIEIPKSERIKKTFES